MRQPINLKKRLDIRKRENAFRELKDSTALKDFSSNDYLGFTRHEEIFRMALSILEESQISGKNGASGSRLLTGNHQLYSLAEEFIKDFHDSEAALIYNSGYDANIGALASIPQREDIILYDELVHASIREGIKLGNAKAFKFKHNDTEDLEKILKKHISAEKGSGEREVYIVTESVFSMDGDIAPLNEIVDLGEKYKAFIIVDEAHSTGIFGAKGEGLVQELELQEKIFLRIVTFGKALGAHGACVLGSKELREFLINFSRSFIYTTGLPPHTVATILAAYRVLNNQGAPHPDLEVLHNRINFFKNQLAMMGLNQNFPESRTAIQCCIIPGNAEVKQAAIHLQEMGFDVRPILSPTVPSGKERLRICLHSFNSEKDIRDLVEQMAIFIK